VLVVTTAEFEVYHDLVTDLRDRDIPFTTVEPGEELPPGVDVVVTAAGEDIDTPAGVTVVEAAPDEPRAAVETAVAALRGASGRTVVGIDPGDRPGIAVLRGETVVATFQVSPGRVPEVVRRETTEAEAPLVRIGDGARLVGARIIDDLDLPVELVDETGTTPYLGAGTRGLGDVVAAVNIARREGDRVESREVDPTAGELRRIQDRSRRAGETNRAIDADLARRVARGELGIDEALQQHRD